jgi:hypothetical protein
MDLKKSAIAMGDRYILEKRLEAEDKGFTPIPDWGLESMQGSRVTPVLSQEQIAGLIESQESIWPKGANANQKSQFLEAIDNFLFIRDEMKGQFQINLTPAQQKARLLDAVEVIMKAKKSLKGIRDMPLEHAEMAFMSARYSDDAAFNLRCKDEYGEYVSSMFAKTWMYLDDTESTLKCAVRRITITKDNKPSTCVNEGFLKRSAGSWYRIFGTWPPHSKDGCFFRFFQSLGRIINEEFTAHEISKAVREAKDGNWPPV